MQSTCAGRYKKPQTLWKFKERRILSCQGMREGILEEAGCEWCVKGTVSLRQKEEVMGTTAKALGLVTAKLGCVFGKGQVD